jgi:anti-sigma factor ChrR (cupin superfamily)
MHPNDEAINDYVEGTSDPAERSSIERHLATCAPCRQLADDLRDIARATATLELREPPVRVWGRVERAIRLDRDADGARALDSGARAFEASENEAANDARLKGSRSIGTSPSTGGSRSRWAPWLAAAAALVLATVVGLRFLPGRGPTNVAPAAVETPSAGNAADAIESELRLAESHYENAIKGLEQAARSDAGALDPKTAATLQKNLAVIDQAISESRAAMRSQPASEPAQQSLVENFKTKIALLQDTVALINEMRKGNEAGAARIVSGLKTKGN